MDLSKLSANDKLALYGSVAVLVGGIVSTWGGALWISVLAAVGMLAVLFLPQIAPNTTLPGSKGSLMVVLGGAAALFAVLSALSVLGFVGYFFNPFSTLVYIVAIGGSLLMGWAGWQAFQAEGGKLDLRMPASMSGGASSTTTPPAPPPSSPEPTTTAPTAAAPESAPAAAAQESSDGSSEASPEDEGSTT